MVNLTQAIKNKPLNVGRKLDCNFYYRLYFLDLKLERVFEDHLRSEMFSEGVHNNWSYHCLYFQTPGQLENFFKLESCLLDISAKTIILPENPFIEIFLFQIQDLVAKHLFMLKQVPSWSCDYHWLLKFILGNSCSSYKSSAKLILGISQQSMLKASVLQE